MDDNLLDLTSENKLRKEVLLVRLSDFCNIFYLLRNIFNLRFIFRDTYNLYKASLKFDACLHFHIVAGMHDLETNNSLNKEALQDLSLMIASVRHDLEATQRERDALQEIVDRHGLS
jgi:hypothetical protein